MIIQSYDNIENIKQIWQNLYKSNNTLTTFQSYEWNKELENVYRNRKYKILNSLKLKYFIIDNSIIAPLVIDRFRKKIFIIGQHECSDYLSFIFDDLSKEKFEFFLSYLMKSYHGYQLVIDRINEKNPMINILKTSKYIIEKPKKCFGINIPDIDSSFYNNLSKNVRQNYRTANNRMVNDNILKEINIYKGMIKSNEAIELLAIYKERRIEKSAKNGFYKRIYEIRRLISLLFNSNFNDVITNYSTKYDVFLTKIILNNELAAFYEGFIGLDGNISIIRAATNQKYYKYSPGSVLLIETIESLKGKVKFFDLTRGEEDYKIKHGAKLHFNYCFIYQF